MKVLVVTVEGLQLSYLGCYGNEWVATPHLDQLAAEGVVFDRHIADQPSPAGACRTWRTGCYGLPLLDRNGPDESEESSDLVRVLRRGGIKTVQISLSSLPLSSCFQADWEHVSETTEQKLPKAVAKAVQSGSDGLVWVGLGTLRPPWEASEESVAECLGQEDEDEDEPLIPLTDPALGPIDAEDDAMFLRLQRGYAGAVTALDTFLGELLDCLRERDLLDELLLIFTTDYGLPVGEHAMVGDHRPWLHQELVHLPLLMRLPSGREAGRRVSALTQAVDLMPTLLDAFGLPLPEVHGRSLLPLAEGRQESIRDYACSGWQVGDAVELALRTRDWAYLLPVRIPEGDAPRGPQLYVKPDDRWEVNNILQHHSEFAEHLDATLQAFVVASRRPGPLQIPVLRAIDQTLTPAVEMEP